MCVCVCVCVWDGAIIEGSLRICNSPQGTAWLLDWGDCVCVCVYVCICGRKALHAKRRHMGTQGPQ